MLVGCVSFDAAADRATVADGLPGCARIMNAVSSAVDFVLCLVFASAFHDARFCAKDLPLDGTLVV